MPGEEQALEVVELADIEQPWTPEDVPPVTEPAWLAADETAAELEPEPEAFTPADSSLALDAEMVEIFLEEAVDLLMSVVKELRALEVQD